MKKFNKNAKVEKFTSMLGIAVRLIVIDPLCPFDYTAFEVSGKVGNPYTGLTTQLNNSWVALVSLSKIEVPRDVRNTKGP